MVRQFNLQIAVYLTVLAMCLGEASSKAAPTAAAMVAGTVTDSITTAGEQLLVTEAQRWGVKVHRHSDIEELKLVLPCGGMQTTQELDTINPQGILLAKEHIPRRRTCALATFPFVQQIPMSQARRYLSRDSGCAVLDDKGDGSVALVQANVVDLNDGWYQDCTRYVLDGSDDLNAALQSALGTDTLHSAGIDPEAIRQLRILARKLFGAVADEQPIIICARRWRNPNLVFVGRAEDIHLFLRSEAVRKELGITDWTHRGYTARDRTSSYFFNFCSRDVEVELGAWDELIAMYRDDSARTLTTVQPLWQFKREKQLGEEIPDTTCT